jgi:hypothetical protein
MTPCGLDAQRRSGDSSVVKRIGAIVLALVLIVGLAAPVVEARGHGASVALGLASFAVFTSLVAPFAWARPVYVAPVYVAPAYAPPVYYYQQVYTPPPAQPTYPTVVQYPHGRYELRGDGIYTAYQWVWIPNPPPPPPPPAPPAYSPPPPPAPTQ